MVSGVETTLLEVCVLLEIISIVEPDLVPGGLVECVSVGVRFKHLLWFAFRGVFLVICFSRLRDSTSSELLQFQAHCRIEANTYIYSLIKCMNWSKHTSL